MKAAVAACGLPPCTAVRIDDNKFALATSSSVCFAWPACFVILPSAEPPCDCNHFFPAPPLPIAAAMVDTVGTVYGTASSTLVVLSSASDDRMRNTLPRALSCVLAVACVPATSRIWRVDTERAEGMERVCEERRTENWRSHRRSTISCDCGVTAARRTCEDVRARRETGPFDEEEMNEKPVSRRGESARGGCEDRMKEFNVPSRAAIGQDKIDKRKTKYTYLAR